MFYIERSEDTVRYWSHRRLQLPRPSGLSAGYSDLQAALLTLSPRDDCLLSCRYWSNDYGGDFDVENVLIYNPGPGCLAKASVNGIAFAPVHQVPPLAPNGISYRHLNEYMFRPATYPNQGRIVESVSFPLFKMDRGMIWRAAAQALADEGADIDGEFGLHVTVASPFRRINPANRLKQLFDGFIAALQCDSMSSDEAVSRLSSHCGLPLANTLHLLRNRKPRLAVASQKPLVRSTTNGFGLNPADHLCTEGTFIAVVGDSPQCTATIYRIDRPLAEIPASPSDRQPESTAPATRIYRGDFAIMAPSSPTNSRIKHRARSEELSAFADWLAQQGYAPATVKTFLSDARRVQASYGNLNDEYNRDRLAALKKTLRYTSADMAEGRPNPTNLNISSGREGNMSKSIYNNLQAAMSEVKAFERFMVSR